MQISRERQLGWGAEISSLRWHRWAASTLQAVNFPPAHARATHPEKRPKRQLARTRASECRNGFWAVVAHLVRGVLWSHGDLIAESGLVKPRLLVAAALEPPVPHADNRTAPHGRHIPPQLETASCETPEPLPTITDRS